MAKQERAHTTEVLVEHLRCGSNTRGRCCVLDTVARAPNLTAMKKLPQRSTRDVHANPYWTYAHDRYQLPDGSEGDYWWVRSRGSVFVVPRIGPDRFVLVRQFRYLNQRVSLEFPGGGIPEGLTPADAAANELREEAGYVADTLVPLGVYNPCNGVTNELCQTFLADDLRHVGQRLEPSEDIELVELDSAAIRGAIRDGTLWDGMTMAAWALFTSARTPANPEP